MKKLTLLITSLLAAHIAYADGSNSPPSSNPQVSTAANPNNYSPSTANSNEPSQGQSTTNIIVLPPTNQNGIIDSNINPNDNQQLMDSVPSDQVSPP